MGEVFEGPPGLEPESAAVEYHPTQPSRQGDQSTVDAVLAANADRLMAIDGVEGVGIGRDRIGDIAIVVYLRDASVRDRVPSKIDGYSVETSVTGIVDAY